MKLQNIYIIGSDNKPTAIEITDGKIAGIGNGNSEKSEIVFKQAIAFPGLINSHDHLEFNLFPQLRSKTYEDYIDWGKDIHVNFKSEINEILQIPEEFRYNWGLIKNLLNGVTSVVNHGPKKKKNSYLIDVYQNFNYIHSMATDSLWRLRVNNLFNGKIPMIHLGEGTSCAMFEEVETFIKWNLLNKQVWAVHAIAMLPEQSKKFKGIIWCPNSNLYLYNKTAQIDLLKANSTILFGTDSALSASADMWLQLREGRSLGFLTDQELFESVTKSPAKQFGFSYGLEIGNAADVVIAKSEKGSSSFDTFFSVDIEDILMVIKNGRILYFDSSLVDQLDSSLVDNFSKFKLGNTLKYLEHNAFDVMKKISQYHIQFPLPIDCHVN